MKAICWNGVNDVSTREVPEPVLVGEHDAIVRVKLSSACGSDLHLIDGFVPTMKKGDILGHELIGEVVEMGRAVRELARGDRVVVSSVIGCGRCDFCEHGEWSLCDNTNPSPEQLEALYGQAPAGLIGYAHAFGGFAGSHAEYVRVPFADQGAFRIPEFVTDDQALFVSDALPTGYMGADLCDIEPGDVVAVWGCGGVGQMAVKSAYLLGADRVIAIDRIPERLRVAEEKGGAETLDYSAVDVSAALREMTGGRGPDACIDAVGMEAHEPGIAYAYDRTKQALHLPIERASVLRQMIHACRKGGTIAIMGVYGGFVDKFPIGAAMNKGLTLRMGMQHGQHYIPELLDLVQQGRIDPSYLMTHKLSLDEGSFGYDIFKRKKDGCLRAVFAP